MTTQDGITFTCDSFNDGLPCASVTEKDSNNNDKTASEACCACGGGKAYVANQEE